MKVWWVLGILLLLLLVLGLRERFETYADALKDVGQTPGYISLTPKCPEGSSLNAEKTMCKFTDTKKADVTPTCSSDTLEFVGGTCRPKAGATTTTGTGTTGGTTTTPPSTGTTGGTTTPPGTAATTSATSSTTGGSSTSSFGPNSGKGRNVFGPTSNGIGDGANISTDSWKRNRYPELMGGDGKSSTRIDGAGITSPSKNWQLTMDGSLPDCKGLGCDENSKYLPFSRQPGDMELIPDPYRVSQQFSAASYSFKTEPTPFLTDFSAFLR